MSVIELMPYILGFQFCVLVVIFAFKELLEELT